MARILRGRRGRFVSMVKAQGGRGKILEQNCLQGRQSARRKPPGRVIGKEVPLFSKQIYRCIDVFGDIRPIDGKADSESVDFVVLQMVNGVCGL